MTVYKLDRLMEETRRIATEYRNTTGQTLPVTPELARYDAGRFLNLEQPDPPIQGVDLVGEGTDYADEDEFEEAGGDEGTRRRKYQVKGRVIFDENKTGHRIGALNFDSEWNALLLVLLDENYESTEIYEMDREAAREAMRGGGSKRGGMTVAKFKALGRLIWDRWNGLNPDEIMENR